MTARTCWPVCQCCHLRGGPDRPEITYCVLGSTAQLFITCAACWDKARENKLAFWEMPRHESAEWILEQWYNAEAEYGTYTENQVTHLKEPS